MVYFLSRSIDNFEEYPVDLPNIERCLVPLSSGVFVEFKIQCSKPLIYLSIY